MVARDWSINPLLVDICWFGRYVASMANVVMFHHVQGLTKGVTALAEQLRDGGHDVVTPDLFDGHQFATIDAGVAHLESIGLTTLIERGQAAVADQREDLVFAGVSMGVICAQHLAQTRPGTAGAVLMESCLPASEFGDGWPSSVPVQIHGMSNDRFFAGEGDIDNARAIVASAPAGVAELFEYRGDQHLFVDSSMPAYNQTAATLVVERVLAFLTSIETSREGCST